MENDPENQRYVTEEFLADMAESKSKPGWWKEFLGWIRQQLRKIFPKLKITDRDIEWALARARRRVGRNNSVVKKNLTTELRAAIDEDGNYFPGPNEWGTAYTSMRGKELEAIEFLFEKQEGFVPGAFYRPEVGDIDIVYGRIGTGIDDKGGYGLAHIAKRHPDVNWSKITDTINNGTINPAKRKKKDITSEDGKIILRINQKGRNWVISAFSNTSAEEILSASAKNGSDAFYRRGLYTIGDVFENVKPDNEKNLKKDDLRASMWGGTDQEQEEQRAFISKSRILSTSPLYRLKHIRS